MRERAFSITLEAGWMYGPVDGHVQTPSGGNLDATSTCQRIHFDHDQDVPNDMEMEAGPLPRLGVEARF